MPTDMRKGDNPGGSTRVPADANAPAAGKSGSTGIPLPGTPATPPSTQAGTANSVADSAKQAASQLADQVKEQAKSRADQQKDTAASGLAAVAEAVRQMGEGLRQHEQGAVTQYAAQYGDSIASQIERLSDHLQHHDVSELITDLESFARRRPGLFLGGSFLLGMAATRFLKSSRPARPSGFTTPPPSPVGVGFTPPTPVTVGGTEDVTRASGSTTQVFPNVGVGVTPSTPVVGGRPEDATPTPLPTTPARPL